MDKGSLACQVGCTEQDEKKLDAAEHNIRTGYQALLRLEEIGLRECKEREECEALLAGIAALRSQVFGTSQATAQ